MANKLGKFLEEFGGFIVGALIGILLVLCKVVDIIVTIVIVVGFGFLGTYIQRNKNKVKEVLKNLIEKW